MSTFFRQTAQAMIAKHIDRFPLLKLDQETFAKKSFPQQPKPKQRFSAISLPKSLLILPKCPLNPPRTPHNW
ncbi:MAG: IS5/IS1182 family transposase, partial [Eikenella corrodens]